MLAVGDVCHNEGDEIPNGTMIGHKAWVLYDTPELKIELIPSKHPGSPIAEKLKTTLFLKSYGNHPWECQCVRLTPWNMASQLILNYT